MPNQPIITRKIPLVGGLGNQLFILTYSIWQSEINGNRVKILTVPQSRSNNLHGNNVLEDLVLEMSFQAENLNLIGTLRNKLERFLSRQGGGQFLIKLTSRVHLSDGELIDKGIGMVKTSRVRTLIDSGYFASTEYLRDIQKKGFLNSINPKNPSTWFSEQHKRLGKQWLGIHVRRGDFKAKKGPGVLGEEYYRRGIEVAVAESKPLQIVLFTDDSNAVRLEFKNLIDKYKIDIIEPPLNVPAAESLALLSNCESLIMANSTFSFWAAQTGTQKLVIAPRTWSRFSSDSSSLLASHWKILDPVWE